MTEFKRAVTDALRRALTDHLQRQLTLAEAVARAAAALVAALPDPSERPSERCARENALAMEIMTDHHARGRGRCGAASAAKRLAIDPSDMLERERLEQRFRRVWRDAFLTLDQTDIANMLAALPDKYWGPNVKIYISAFGYATFLARLGATSGGDLWDADAPSPGPLWNGIPCVLTPKLPGAGDQTGKIMLLAGDMSKAVALGSRRDITLATSLHRFLDTDSMAYRCSERFDVAVHNVGDATTPGAIVGLQGTA